MSGEELARQVTVRTSAEWKTLWQGHEPTEKMPVIDFSTRMVVGVFLGSKPSAGYDVEIVRGTVTLRRHVQKQPGRGTMAAQILTEPPFLAVAKILARSGFCRSPIPGADVFLSHRLQSCRLNRPRLCSWNCN